MTEPHERLWPSEPGSQDNGTRYAIVGSPEVGQLLVPLDSRRAASEAFVKFDATMGLADRALRRSASLVARSGVFRFLTRRSRWIDLGDKDHNGSLLSILSAATGKRDLQVAASFGPPRANQKPILRIMRSNGTTIAYAKVAWNDLTHRLIENEVKTLRLPQVGQLKTVTAPEVLYTGPWLDKSIAVFGALRQQPGKLAPSNEAFEEVAGMWGIEEYPLAGSDFVRALEESAAQLIGPAAELGIRVVDRLVMRYGNEIMPMGGWHGDWTPWNNARCGSRIALWDWERAGAPSPLGLDSIHYRFQPLSVEGDHTLTDLLNIATAGISADRATAMTLGHIYTAAIAFRHLGPNTSEGPQEKSLGYLAELDQLLTAGS